MQVHHDAARCRGSEASLNEGSVVPGDCEVVQSGGPKGGPYGNPAESLCSYSCEKAFKHHMALVKFAVCFLGFAR